VRAQQPALPVIGFLYAGSEATPPLLAAFRDGLAATGHIEGRNVAVEYRWANNALDRLPELAAEVVRLRVAVIATPGSYQAALAAKAASATIPIVFSTGVDPVGSWPRQHVQSAGRQCHRHKLHAGGTCSEAT
jgi:putative ABC transport system substrate-binding protein